MARFDPKTYAKNVLRSAGYITVESIKGVNPTLTSYITETASSAKEMYDFAKDFKRNFKNKSSEAGNEFTKEFEKHKKNILDDIRTGKFYNPEREKATLDEYMKKEGFSFDDLDFDVDEDFGEDSSESSSGETKAINSLSMTQQKLTAASTDEIVRAGRINTKLSIKTTNKMFGMVNNSLAVINTSILNLHQDLAKPINAHIINSGNFYQAATTEMAMQTKYLENINRILTERYETKKKGFANTGYKTSAWEDVFGGGLPNFKKWGSHAKTKFMNSSGLGFITDLLSPDMTSMMSDSGALSSPIAQLAIFALTSKLQSSKFGKSLDRTENILKGGFTQLAAAISSGAKNTFRNKKTDIYGKNSSILTTILEALDITPKANKKIDHSKYNRGPIDWDGESKKALTEVIPTQLAMIISQLGGTPKVFNYKTGRWETVKQATKEFKKERREAIASENYRFKDTITKDFIDEYNAGLATGESMMTYRSKGTLALSRDFDRVMEYFTLNNIDSFANAGTVLNDLAQKGIISKRSAEQLKRSFNKHAGSFSSAVYNSRIGNNKFMASAGQGTFGMISNGSGLAKASYNMNKAGAYTNSILGLKDNKGHDIYFYLQSFYSSFKYLEDALSTQNFSRGRGRTFRRRNNRYDVPISEELRRIQEQEERQDQTRNRREGSSTHITDEYDSREGTFKKSSFNKTEQKAKEEEKSSIFTRGVEKFNDMLSKMFFGNNNINQMIANGGLFGAIQNLPDNIAKAIDAIKDKAKNWIGEKWRNFKESNFGKEYFGSIKDQVKGMGRSIWGHTKQSAGRVVEFFSNKGFKPSAARGGFVTKSGMISVSEGEMIIPSEKNPFYKGRTNKSSQRAQEAMNYRNWLAQGGNEDDYWGSFRKGGKAKKPKLSDRDKKKIDELLEKGLDPNTIAKRIKKNYNAVQRYITSKSAQDVAEEVIDAAETTASKAVSGAKSKFSEAKDEILNSELGQKAAGKMKDMLSRADQAMNNYFGDKYTGTKDITKSAMNTIKKSLPQTMAAGTIGAVIAGAMTGSGLGLLGGFAVGAGIHVLKNSDDISRKLFGDEKGEGGMLPPKVSNFIKKRLPGLAKSGAIGSVLGAMGVAPGGILGGFVLGAGIDMLAHQEKVQNMITSALFGNEGVDGKRRGGIIGSLKVRVVDPLANYVKTGIGKVGNYLKETIFNNVNKLFVPITDWVKGKGRRILEGIGSGIKSAFDRITKNIGELFDKTIGRVLSFFGFSADKIIKGAASLIKLPFNAIGGAGEALNRHNIRMGYSSASAKDRVKAMGNKASAYDRTLADLESSGKTLDAEDYIQTINFYANNTRNNKKALASQRADLADKIVASMDNGGAGDPKAVDAIRSAMKKASVKDKKTGKITTDYGQVISDIRNGYFRGLAGENAEQAARQLEIEQAFLNKKENQLDNWNATQKEIFSQDRFKNLDIWKKNGELDQKKLDRLRFQTFSDYARIDKSKKDDWTNDNNNTLANINKKLEEERKNNPLDNERNTFLGKIVNLMEKIAIKNNIDVKTESAWDKVNKNSTNKPSTEGNNDNSSQSIIGTKERGEDGILYEIMENGDRKPDMSDEQTKKIISERESQKEESRSLFKYITGGGLLAGFSKIFGIKKEEKKETIFDKLKKLLGGAASAIGGFLSPITSAISGLLGNLAGGGLSGLLSGIGGTITKGLGEFITGGGLATALSAVGLGWLFNKAHDKLEGTDKDSRVRKGIDLSTLKSSKDMNPLERAYYGSKDVENVIRNRNMLAYGKDDFVSDYAVDREIKTTGFNLVSGMAFGGKIGSIGAKVVGGTVGNIPIIGKALAAPMKYASKLGSNLPKVSELVKKGATKLTTGEGGSVFGSFSEKYLGKRATNFLTDVADNGLISTIADRLKSIFNWVFNKLGIKQAGAAADEAAETAGQAIAQNGGASLGKLLSTIGTVVYIGRIILALEDGFEKPRAKVILGITIDPTIPQRLLAAALNAVNYAIPGIGGLIPTEVLFNILYWVFNKFGIDLGGLDKARAEAKITLEEYRKATNNPGATLEEYVHNELGEYTTQEKVKKVIGGAASKVKDFGTGVVKGAKNLGSKAVTTVKSAGSKAIKGIKNFGTGVANSAKNLIAAAGTKLAKGKDYLKEAITAVTGLAGDMEKVFVNRSSKMSDVINVKPKIKEDNPLYGITNTISNNAKVAIVPGLFIKYTGIKIGKSVKDLADKVKTAIEPYIETAKTVAQDIGDTVSQNIDSFKAGDIVGLWTNKSTVSEDNPLGVVSTAANIATSAALTMPTVYSFIGHKIVGGIKSVAEFVVKEANNIGAIGKATREYMVAGDLKGLISSDNSDAGGETGTISTIANWGYKFGYLIPTAINALGNKISEIFTKAKNSIPDIKNVVSKLWEYSDTSKDFGTYKSTVESFKVKDNSDIYSGVNNSIVTLTGGIMEMALRIVRAIRFIGDKVGDVVDWGKDKVDWVGNKVSGAWNTVTTTVDNAATSAKNFVTGTGSGVHVTQKGSHRRFGSSDIDENGCGPATAATVLRAYGKGGNLEDAARYAELGGYVAGRSGTVGTRASYFSDILGANGIRTSYTSSKNSIRGAVGSGNPTILLGQDRSNRSKRNSPFGPNPHYVVARGSDSKGHVLIDDPELGAPAIYNKSILNKAKLGVLTGGGSNAIQADDGAVWNYLKSAGLTDAGVAGLMGNLYAESGIKSNKVEASSIKKSDIQANDYSRNYGFTYDSNSYTAAVDKGLKQGLKGSAEENLKPTFGVIPEYEFVYMPWKVKKKDGTIKFGQNGYGLVQWTSPGRKQGLYNLAKQKNVSISDKQMQLEYLLYELKNSFPGVYNTLKSTNSLTEASNKVLIDFEDPQNAESKKSERASFGQTYYDKFSKNPPTDTSFGSTSSDGSTNNTAQNISFPTYNLNESQLKGAANIIQHEQGGIQGRYAEASLMANQVDMRDDSKATASNLVSKLTSGWFAHGSERYNAGANGSVKIETSALAAATDVFNNGKRVLPRYVDEHDCFSDFAAVDGKSTGLTKGMGSKARIANTPAWVKDRSIYKPGTAIDNVYKSHWKFSLFPDSKSDAFGYTSEELRQKHGEAHYSIDEQGNITAPAGYSNGTTSTIGGTSVSTVNGSDSRTTNLAGILSSAFSTVFSAIGSKLSGKAGSIFKLLTGGINLGGSNNTESSNNTNGTNTNTNSSVSISPGNLTPYNGEVYDGDAAGKVRPLVGVSAENHPALNVINAARSQLGVKERGKNGQDFGILTGNTNDKWCASFVSWAFHNGLGGDKEKGKAALYGPYSACVQGLLDNFKGAGKLTKDPQPGDVIIWKTSKKSHVGIVQAVNGNGTVTTVEGNSGDMVKSNVISLSDGNLTGFGRPNWDAVDTRSNKTGFATSINNSDSPTVTGSSDDGFTASGSGLPLYKYIGGKSAAGASSEYDYDDRDDGHVKPYPTGYGTPHSMIEIARSQLGVLEGGLGEKDKSGKWIPHSGNITDYGKFMGMDKQPWCASFVSWVMDKTFNGAKNKRNYALRGNPSAAVDGLWSNFKAAGEMHDIPEPGDVVIYKNDTSHTGIVETVNGKHITTIEGNTSSGNTFDRNGGIVFRKEFTIGDGSSMANKLTGFGRPNWDAEKEFGTGSGLYGVIGSGSFSSGFKDANTKAKIKNKHNTSGGFVRATTRDEDEFNAYQATNYKRKQQQPVKTVTNNSSANFHTLNSDMSSLYAYQNKKAAASYEADRIAYANQQEALRAAKSWADDEKAQAIQRANIANAAAYEAEMAAIAADPTAGKSKYWWEVEQYNLKNTPDAGRSKALAKSSGTSSNSSGGSYSGSSGSYYGSSAPVANTTGSIDATSLNSILEYLKTIAENSKYEATLPTIVDLVSKLAGITATVNSNSTSIENQDKVNNINSDISAIIQKLDAISSSL